MKKEKWLKWEPLSGIAVTFYLKNLKYEQDLLTLEAQSGAGDSTPIFDINFHDFITFRTMFESDKLLDSYDYEEAIVETTKEGRCYCSWNLFKVENSHYIEWFRQQNVCINHNIGIVHYLVLTPQDLIEVLVPEDCNPIAVWR